MEGKRDEVDETYSEHLLHHHNIWLVEELKLQHLKGQCDIPNVFSDLLRPLMDVIKTEVALDSKRLPGPDVEQMSFELT